MNNLEDVLKEVSEALGVAISARALTADSGYTFAIRIADLPKSTTFEIRIRQGILSWTFDLFLNNFPVEMLTTFKHAFDVKKQEIYGIYDSALSRMQDLSFTVDDIDIKHYEKAHWNQISLSLKVKVAESPDRLVKLKTGLIIVLSLLIPLFTEDKESDEEATIYGEMEGALSKVEKNHYERSRVNRALCLDYYGFECQACFRTMKSQYGPIGNGVIHVHHLEPVSLMNSPRRLDPILDLIPLCPNCHTIAHQESPPVSLDRLRALAQEFR